MIEIIVSFFILTGAGFALVGSIGLVRLPDFFSRLHGPTKSTTLGVGGMLIASATHFSTGSGTSLHELLVTMFLFMTAPVSAHLLCKAALHLNVPTMASGYAERDDSVVARVEPNAAITHLATNDEIPRPKPRRP